MTKLDTKAQVTLSLSKLIGLPLAIARDAADMKNFHFGVVGPHSSGKGTVGQYALHIQCPWRICGAEGIVTGLMDHYEPTEIDGEVALEDGRYGNLQRARLGGLLGSYDEGTRSWVNGTGHLIVEEVLTYDLGGFELVLSGGFRLQVLPCGSRGEDWRFFAPGSDDHLVIDGGRVST